MWAIYFILIFSQIELPPGCEARIKVHIKNNTNVIFDSPKIYRLSSPWLAYGSSRNYFSRSINFP
jgi:hypothetical protein